MRKLAFQKPNRLVRSQAWLSELALLHYYPQTSSLSPDTRALLGPSNSLVCLWAAHCEGSVTEATLGQLPESWSRAAVEPKAARSHQTEAETNGMTTQFT